MDQPNESEPNEGTIIIRWSRLPEPYRSDPGLGEFDWAYEPDPPTPDEVAARLLRAIADRL